MIKANEFRVGNYIKNLINKSFGIDKTLVVCAIFSNRVHPVNTCSKEIYPNLGCVCEAPIGIPLTEEWKNRLGVKINKYYDESGLLMMNIKTDFFDVNCQMEEIKYVHQLQNIYFALTNEELTFKEINN